MSAPAEQTHTIQLDGRRFAWRSLGQGPPLLLINGYAAGSADWDPAFLGALAAHFQLICPDNRGIGESELGEEGELSVDGMAGDLEALLDELDIDRLSVAGWSMGGFLAQALAMRAPRRVAALVLPASAPGGPTATAAEPRVWEMLLDHTGPPRRQAARLISLLFPPELAPEIDRQFGDLVAGARSRLSPRALDAQERVLNAWHDQPPRLPGSDAPPVLILCGGEDVVLPPQNAAALAAVWPDARVERIEGGGHAFMAQQPELVARLIADFLDTSP